MQIETISLQEGDIYHWRWADPAKDADCAPYRSYHCCSQLAVVRCGRLRDTYWHGFDNKILKPAEVTLSWLGNTADLTEIRPCDIAYYRREDIVDMRHANNSHGPVYLRKGASRDAATMLALVEHRIECAHREIEFSRRRIEQLVKDVEKINAGELGEVYL